jgi:hypothetical protein
MDLLAMKIAEDRRRLEMTVLHRPAGTWSTEEVMRLVNGLRVTASAWPKKPEFVVLYGHHTKDETLQVLGGGIEYTALQVTGADSKDLPFIPSFLL